jgi:hypothetical protein
VTYDVDEGSFADGLTEWIRDGCETTVTVKNLRDFGDRKLETITSPI